MRRIIKNIIRFLIGIFKGKEMKVIKTKSIAKEKIKDLRLIDTISSNYNDLVKILDNPTFPSIGSGKTSNEWVVKHKKDYYLIKNWGMLEEDEYEEYWVYGDKDKPILCKEFIIKLQHLSNLEMNIEEFIDIYTQN
tara:strand:- start:492 stop:899 length:408 start_codon:yes stop_codon:yes gene_type:complete